MVRTVRYGISSALTINTRRCLRFRMSFVGFALIFEGRGERVYGLLLELLRGYARVHFGFEEACMERCQCPAATEYSGALKVSSRLLGVRGALHDGRLQRVELSAS